MCINAIHSCWKSPKVTTALPSHGVYPFTGDKQASHVINRVKLCGEGNNRVTAEMKTQASVITGPRLGAQTLCFPKGRFSCIKVFFWIFHYFITSILIKYGCVLNALVNKDFYCVFVTSPFYQAYATFN